MELKVKVRRLDGALEEKALLFNSCVAIGYAGRDQESVRLHVEELARLGVPRPASIPSMYWVSPAQIVCTDNIQVVGEETSAEVEFFMAPDAEGRLYFTVVSDHSDRKPVSSLLGWEKLLELAKADAPCEGPVAFCSGTVPVVGGQLRYASAWDIRMEDQKTGRSIEQHYDVLCLDDRN